MPVVRADGLSRTVSASRVVVIIPARYQSSRFPGKPLATIAGRPMIEHVYLRARECRLVDAVIVATDDERIAAAVDGFGGVAVMTSAAHATGTDRLAEVAAHLTSEIIVNVQGDEPIIEPTAVDAAIRALADHPADQVATLRRRIHDPDDLDNPSVVKLVVDLHGRALYFTRARVPFVRTRDHAAGAWRHLGLYVYRREFLLKLAALAQTPLERTEALEQLRVLEHGYVIRTVETTADAIGVDTPDDLDRIRRYFETASVKT